MSEAINKNRKILICDADATLCYLLKQQLLEEGYAIDIVNDGMYAIEKVKTDIYDVLFLDLNMKEVQGKDVLKIVVEYNSTIQIIMLAAEAEMGKVIECIKNGAYDFINKPYDLDILLFTLKRAIEYKYLLIKNDGHIKENQKNDSDSIIGSSPLFKRVLNLANKAAMSDSNILIVGETGTSKELMAKNIHKHSARREKPFVGINCASLPDQLIEIELFGYEKNVFTDEKKSKQGLFEIADGGTLFLDEISELSLTLQPRLLRFLENGEYNRIGGFTSLKTNVRVISATNENLLEESDKKNFGKNLLYRLNVINLVIPPLRERKEDILLLSNHFLKIESPNGVPKILAPEAEEILLNYTFTGNVRELGNIIKQAITFSEGNYIYPEDLNLPQNIQTGNFSQPSDETVDIEDIINIEDLERWHIQKILNKNKWDRTRTASQLGISQKTLYTKIKK